MRKKIAPTILALVIAVVVTGLFVFPYDKPQGLLTRLERLSYDARMRLRGPYDAMEEIRIVGIDNDTLEIMERRSTDISRHDYAQVIRNLASAGAGVIAVDVLFTHPTKKPPPCAPMPVSAATAATSATGVTGPTGVTAPVEGVPGEMPLEQDPQGAGVVPGGSLDGCLGLAWVGNTGAVQAAAEASVEGASADEAAYAQDAYAEEGYEEGAYAEEGYAEGEYVEEGYAQTGAEEIVLDLEDPDDDLAAAILEAGNVVLARYVDKGVAREPLELFMQGAWAQANISVTPDPDNVVRSVPLLEAQTLADGSLAFYRSLGFEAVAPFLEQGEAQIEFTDYGAKFGDIRLYGDLGNYYINYVGPSHTFEYVPFGKIWSGDFAREEVEGKILFIANILPSSHDFYSTPFDEKRESAGGEATIERVARQMPGVEIHANMAQSLLMNQPIRFLTVTETFPFLPKIPDRFYSAAWLLLIGLIFGYIFIVSKWSVVWRVTLWIALLGGYYTVAQLQYNYTNLMLQVAPYLTMLTATFVGGVVYRAVVEGAEKIRITRTFGQYVSPQVVAELVDDPAKASLGGEKRVMTVMFSDIRGFTTMSEALDPVELVNFLNEYLTAMTEIIFNRGGVVDKYMGDAIMAFWGAPITMPDHAKRACLTSLDMMETLGKMREDWRKRQLPDIDIGIGLNTGPMTVGNMGSAVRFDYTVMGDSVNLGSRLEGINKEYGTNIIISEFTRAQIPEDMVCRELDLVAVKGKKEPVRIFELMAVVASSTIQRRVDLWNDALALYKNKKFLEAKAAFEHLLEQFPDDGPSKTYVKRCVLLHETPPPETWDGVYVMTTK